MFNHSHIRHFSSVFVSLRDFELITQNSSENITSRQSRCIYVNGIIQYSKWPPLQQLYYKKQNQEIGLPVQ